MDIVARRRTTAFEMDAFSETRIEGAVHLNAKSIAVFQMPFDRGWHALVDGQPAKVIKVDAGLLGLFLDAGSRKVQLNYRPPFLYEGAAVSIMACAVLLFSLRRWPRICLRSNC